MRPPHSFFPLAPRQGGEGWGEGVAAGDSHIDLASVACENPLTPTFSPFQGAREITQAP
jgi:hypothetical protein